MTPEEKVMLDRVTTCMQDPQCSTADLRALVKEIIAKHEKSALLQFFAGVVYQSRLYDPKQAEVYYEKAVKLNHKFAHATFALAELTLSRHFVRAEKLLLDNVFDQYTYDPYSDQLYFQPLQTLRAFTILAPYYPLAVAVACESDNHSVLELGQLQKAETLSKRVIAIVKDETLPSCRSALHIEAIKLAHQTLARVYNKIDKGSSEPSFIQYCKGLSYNTNTLSAEDKKRHHLIDRALLEGAALSVNYFLADSRDSSDGKSQKDWKDHVDRIYKSMPSAVAPVHANDKIHVGYLSPDFNMNAVSLFLTAVLKHHDPARFKLYCYYARPDCDKYTKMMMGWPGIEWTNVTYRTDEDVYKLMTERHKLDILVDLISLGAANRMPLIALKPAKVVVNYLGYPNKCYQSAVTHRIVDRVTDPPESENETRGEKLVRMNRCFVNFTLFENIATPRIVYRPHMVDEVRIGIFNKSAKYSTHVLAAWNNILAKNPRVVLYVKQDERMHHDPTAYQAVEKLFPPGRVRPLPVLDDLTSYYEQFNQVEFTLDTFPYSGTTTTCNSLYMGVPVVTVYDARNPHVCNVSASILKHVGEDGKYLCRNLEEYEARVLELVDDLPCKSMQDRVDRRERFLRAMDCDAFMREYEGVLESLVKREKQS